LPQSFQESYANNDFENGRKELLKFAKRLKVKLEQSSIEAYEEHLKNEHTKKDDLPVKNEISTLTGVTLLSTVWLNFATLLLYVVFLYLPDGSGFNIYIDVTIGSALEFISSGLVIYAIFYIKRKPIIYFILICSFVVVILAVALEASDSPGRTWLDMLGRCFTSACASIFLGYNIDLAPIELRNDFQTWTVLAGRIGAGIAPFVIIKKDSADFWYIHYIVCLIVIIISLIITFLLPETAGTSALQNGDDLDKAYKNPLRMHKLAKVIMAKCNKILNRYVKEPLKIDNAATDTSGAVKS